MEPNELISFQIISAVGTARSYYIEAIQVAKTGDFKGASQLILEGDEFFLEGHQAHFDLIQKEAEGDAVVMNLLIDPCGRSADEC
jgi:cellobiose PTS system EIIA component